MFLLGTVGGGAARLSQAVGTPTLHPGSHPLCLQIDQPTLGMPSREYYFNEGHNRKVSWAGPQRPWHFSACPSALGALLLSPQGPPVAQLSTHHLAHAPTSSLCEHLRGTGPALRAGDASGHLRLYRCHRECP